MGSTEEDGTPEKLAMISSDDQSESFSKSSFHSEPINPLEAPIVRPLPFTGKENMIGPTGAIRKEEFVRVITKSLYSLGYEKSGAILEEESGICLYSSEVTLFMNQLLDGNWDESIATLHKLGILDEDILKSASFLVYENKFFELLEENKVMDALSTLRTQITSLGINQKRVHELSSCFISSDQCALLRFVEYSTEAANSRPMLVERMSKLLPPSFMIPASRLEHLVEQALSVQRKACTFHNSLDSLSLYADHQCGTSQIPSQTVQILQGHQNEVWFLKFSGDGKYLASCSNDKYAIVWEVHENGKLSFKYRLNGHRKPIVVVAWSPDNQQLLTCGQEEVVRRWDVTSGECLSTYDISGVSLISCGWCSDGRRVFCIADDTVYFLDLAGTELTYWNGIYGNRISDMAVTKDGKYISSSDNRIFAHDGTSRYAMGFMEPAAITSFSLSSDDKYLLVNLACQVIDLFGIVDGFPHLMRYSGHKRSRFVIRSCLGGSDQAFVASGSEDSQVYIWLRETGELVQTLQGHSGAVNCVSWNPKNPHMLASASDDHTIRIWGLNVKDNL